MSVPNVVITLTGTDPWENLAAEELLWQGLNGKALVLYRNAPSLILGRHQNPWSEVRWEEVGRRGVPLLRRSTGGGTVWHDEGNLNFSFLCGQATYRREVLQNFVTEALRSRGFPVVVGEKGDLLLEVTNGTDGSKESNGMALRKVSGHAYAFRGGRVLHHATLLCQARLDDLRSVLGTTGELVEWVGTPSRPMPVANLGWEPAEAAQSLMEAFIQREKAVLVTPWEALGLSEPTWHEKKRQFRDRLRSPEWTWDVTPPFRWQGRVKEGYGSFRVEDGLIREGPTPKDEGKYFFSGDFFEYLPKRSSEFTKKGQEVP